METKQINSRKEYIESLSLPDEISHWIWLVYGMKNYHLFDAPESHKVSGKMMLYDISRMDKYDYQQFKETFNRTPYISNETAPWLVERGYDCFKFIEKGWVANMSIYESNGYYEALKQMDRNLIKYQREIKKEEDKLGIREDNKGSLLERRSWVTLFKKETEELLLVNTYPAHYGWCIYEHNEIGKIVRRTEISHDGEILYEGRFKYREFKSNYYLYKYENTNGISVNFDTLTNERRGFKGSFR
jgi:hypothetical protein